MRTRRWKRRAAISGRFRERIQGSPRLEERGRKPLERNGLEDTWERVFHSVPEGTLFLQFCTYNLDCRGKSNGRKGLQMEEEVTSGHIMRTFSNRYLQQLRHGLWQRPHERHNGWVLQDATNPGGLKVLLGGRRNLGMSNCVGSGCREVPCNFRGISDSGAFTVLGQPFA
jgi:hypothetical protein